ncbi:bifunctional UDP-N-acetylmuramoyl-L-alanyl-D-glutamate--2,6-diaminopimelate ligase MurE/UDP-N-acetylmuramoyl-tripeptide--D-alanyl-D-alanine ligase MurF [Amphibiibacter pelophylacis]|uniref:Bifunctional UDP-N-acetylmuramoyl-L-alanyl-D-glutamate--2, 6-diaminopimelate ligase MurE/UDP-N-acetylmuramoyl-tripeptide--D-alanyl-D-alanine ligase MurF n=1 Tax=Amphibiibacter pelophylacis TaxID=1799477 RepID=A0ACC6P5H3_9BURK
MSASPVLTPAAIADWLRQRVTGDLRIDSRQLASGDGFIAWPGAATDARVFVAQALEAGVAAVVVEAEGLAKVEPAVPQDDDRILAVPGLKALLGDIAAEYFGRPSQDVQMLAVTGTNGKTSIAWWLACLLAGLGQRCGVIGTLGMSLVEPAAEGETPAPQWQYTGLTTPDPVSLQGQLARWRDSGVRSASIEASSIGLVEQRLAGVQMRVGVFSNLTQDHLDYHGDMAAYARAKRLLFDRPELAVAVVNIDDAEGEALARDLAAQLPLWTTSARGQEALEGLAVQGHVLARGLLVQAQGLRFELGLQRPGQELAIHPLQTRLIGAFNISNVLEVVATLLALGHDETAVLAGVPRLTGVPGRMEVITPPAAATSSDAAAPALPLVVVDYAHTPDALDKALAALRPLAQARGGELRVVFGCGGNRDPGKRPQMGRIAALGARHVVLTSDNPRKEEPQAILDDILRGIPGSGADTVPEGATLADVQVQVDRARAIAQAIHTAAASDVVLIAGKGHEQDQDIGGVRRPFSDQQQARDALAEQAGRKRSWSDWIARTRELASSEGPEAVTLAPVPRWTVGDIARELGTAVCGDASQTFERVHSDTRTLQPGDLFVALRGERFDANDFLPKAAGEGAVAALAQRDPSESGLSGVVVPDSLAALQTLATRWRARLTLPLIAVTGSNGKTTVTQMIASILRAWLGVESLSTQGNLNNHIGVPLTLMRLRQDSERQHRAAVVELGMNHPGEIAELAAMAQPTVALVNNAQREHLEFMHTIEAVARENGSVLRALPPGGVAVFPHGDEWSGLWQEMAAGRRLMRFALAEEDSDPALLEAEVVGAAVWVQGAMGGGYELSLSTPMGDAEVFVRVAGLHNVRNAIAAAACALAAGAPLDRIVKGLRDFSPVQGRSQLSALAWPAAVRGSAPDVPGTLINDSYNANPDSVRAAIDLLADLPGPHWLVLGDMGEVGDQGPEFHAEVGAYARSRGLTHLWCAGEAARHAATAFVAGQMTSAQVWPDAARLVAALDEDHLPRPLPQTVLVKGSRFMRMEQVVQALQALCGATPDRKKEN